MPLAGAARSKQTPSKPRPANLKKSKVTPFWVFFS